MSAFLYVVLGFGVLLVGYSAFQYLRRAHNRLMDAKENCEKAWSDIEVLLERRQSEVGDLIDLANEHVAHEREVLAGVIDAREGVVEAGTPDEAADLLVSLREATEEVYTLSDEYPDLASSERFDELSESIRNLEQRLENRREQYNEAVAAYNARLRKFPESTFANYYGFTRRESFVASPEAREGVDVGERLDVSPGQDD